MRIEESALFNGVDQALTGIAGAREQVYSRGDAGSRLQQSIALCPGQLEKDSAPDVELRFALGAQSTAVEQTRSCGKRLTRTSPRDLDSHTSFSAIAIRNSSCEAESEFITISATSASAGFVDSVPFVSGPGAPFLTFDPHLRLPYTLNWHVAVQRDLGWNQSITASYVGAAGRRLLHANAFRRGPRGRFCPSDDE